MQSKHHTTQNDHNDLSSTPIYTNFLKACEQGQLSELEDMGKFLPNQIEMFVRTNHFYALKVAALSRHLTILEYFQDLILKKRFKNLDDKDLSVYVWAAEEGHTLLLECLDPIMGPLNRSKAEQIRLACLKAAEMGHAHVIEHIYSVYGRQLSPSLDPRVLYSIASGHGHLNVLISLESMFSEIVIDMIETNGHEPLRVAATNNHLEILEHIERNHPEFQEENKSVLFLNKLALAYTEAKKAGNLHICEHLLELPYLRAHLYPTISTTRTFFPRATLSFLGKNDQVSEPRP